MSVSAKRYTLLTVYTSGYMSPKPSMNSSTALFRFHIAYVLIDAKKTRIIVRVVVLLERRLLMNLTYVPARKTGAHRGGERA